MARKVIKNVTQFVEAIRNIATNDQTELFFRGHADRAYVAEPAIFRNKEHLKNEKHLFNDMITQCPEEFKDCQYTFEYLVKMQHYGLPTRLLDVTSNALVALYFACCSLSGEGEYKDGQVLVYQVQKDAIKNYNSDTVSVLSNLAQLDSDFEVFIKMQQKTLDKTEELLITLEYMINSYKTYEAVILQEKKDVNPKRDERILFFSSKQEQIKNEIVKCLKSYKKRQPLSVKWCDIYLLAEETVNIEYAMALIELELTNLKVLQDLRSKKERFLYFIKQEKSYFVDKIDNRWDVQKIVCVRAKLNNSRIIRQSGLFFLFGMGDIKGEPIIFSKFIKGIKEHYSPTIQEMTNPTILISGQAKQTIIKELRALGISEETLMPEIDSVAKSIKNRYSH